MFWGITLKNSKRYTHVVERTFHVSMAVLKQSSKHKTSTVSVMIEHKTSTFVLCTLQHGQLLQQALDLNFDPGDTITLYLNGKGTVDLTGCIVKAKEEEKKEESDEKGDMTEDEQRKLISTLSQVLRHYGQLEGEEDSDNDSDQEQHSDDDDTSPQLANKKRKVSERPASKEAVNKVKADDSDGDDSSAYINVETDSSDEQTPMMGWKQSDPQLIKTPQSVQKMGKQQHAASPSSNTKSNPLFEVRNGKGGQQQQKSPAETKKTDEEGDPVTHGAIAKLKKKQRPEKINKLAGGTRTNAVVVGSGPAAKPGKYVMRVDSV